MSANDRQVGGEHYMGSIQHWDFAAQRGYDYFQGQITKYVDRWKNKNGLQDLKKAQHFLEKYIELVEAGTAYTVNNPAKTLSKEEIATLRNDCVAGISKKFGSQDAEASTLMRAPAFYEIREHFETEGFTAEGDFWRCKKCRGRFQVKVGDNPATVHSCPPPGEPTGGYVDQD